jgi:hypothetical protein
MYWLAMQLPVDHEQKEQKEEKKQKEETGIKKLTLCFKI